MSHKTAAAVVHTIGIDTGKNTLHLIGLDDKGTIVLRKKISRGEGLPLGKAHQIGRRRGRQPTAIEPRQNINPIQLSFAHQHHTHRIRSLQTSRPRGRRLTFQLCSVLTF